MWQYVHGHVAFLSDLQAVHADNNLCLCTGYRVVMRCMQPRVSEVTLPFLFQPSRWYHVVITHTTGSALSSSMVRLFVDGNLEASSKFKYFKVHFKQASSCIPHSRPSLHSMRCKALLVNIFQGTCTFCNVAALHGDKHSLSTQILCKLQGL